MRLVFVLVTLVVLASVPSFAANSTATVDEALATAPPVDPDEAATNQLLAITDEVYAREGGKRSKEIIRAEILGNSTISGFSSFMFKKLNAGDYEAVHSGIIAVEVAIDETAKNQPKAKLDRDKLAAVYWADGQAYADSGKVPEAVKAYNKSLSYKKTAQCYFSLGFMYTKHKDFKNGDKNFKLAAKLDKRFEAEAKKSKAYLQNQ